MKKTSVLALLLAMALLTACAGPAKVPAADPAVSGGSAGESSAAGDTAVDDAFTGNLISGEVVSDYQQVHLEQSVFRVGQAERYTLPKHTEEPTVLDGWVWDGTWYYYENGAPRTGWYCYNGADYYLKEDGSVTIGWKQINGKMRYFSNTGCMRTGWIDTETGRMYLMSNGAPAVGKRIIDGTEYVFDVEGILKK